MHTCPLKSVLLNPFPRGPQTVHRFAPSLLPIHLNQVLYVQDCLVRSRLLGLFYLVQMCREQKCRSPWVSLRTASRNVALNDAHMHADMLDTHARTRTQKRAQVTIKIFFSPRVRLGATKNSHHYIDGSPKAGSAFPAATSSWQI